MANIYAASRKDLNLRLLRLWNDDPVGGDVSGTPALDDSVPEISDLDRNHSAGKFFFAGTTTPPSGSVVSYDYQSSIQKSGLWVGYATTTYESGLAGVVANEGDSVLRFGTGDIDVALSGKAIVRVNTTNGDIKVGDYLTSSEVPGVAVKATQSGWVVGQAFEGFSGSGEGSVLANIAPGFMTIEDLKSSSGIIEPITEMAAKLADFVAQNSAKLVTAVYGKIVSAVAVIQNLFAHTVTILPDGELVLPEGANQISGTATIQSGASEVTILNSKVSATSKIFVTPTTLTSLPLSVTSKISGQSFTVSVQGVLVNPIDFDWVIISAYPAGSGNSQMQQNSVQGGSSGSGAPSGGSTPDPNQGTGNNSNGSGATTTESAVIPPPDTGSNPPPEENSTTLIPPPDTGSGQATLPPPPDDGSLPPPPDPLGSGGSNATGGAGETPTPPPDTGLAPPPPPESGPPPNP